MSPRLLIFCHCFILKGSLGFGGSLLKGEGCFSRVTIVCLGSLALDGDSELLSSSSSKDKVGSRMTVPYKSYCPSVPG